MAVSFGRAQPFLSGDGQQAASSTAGMAMHKTGRAGFLVGILVAVWSVCAAAQLSDADLVRLQNEGKAKGWTFQIRRTEASRRTTDQLSGMKLPAPEDPYWKTASQRPAPSGKAIPPESWDWRALGSVTAIKDQGGCGSCWAFSTIGVVESAIKIHDGVELDLSEQHLLSCNTAGWGCSGAVWPGRPSIVASTPIGCSSPPSSSRPTSPPAWSATRPRARR